MRIACPRFTRTLFALLAVASLGASCGSSPDQIMVLTSDGGVYIGDIASADGATVVVRDADGAVHKIERSTIVSMGPAPVGEQSPAGGPDESAPDAVADSDAAPDPDPGPAPPPAPTHREVVVPAGTVLTAQLDLPVATSQNQVGDSVTAHVAQSVVVQGIEAVPIGTGLTGEVRIVRRPSEDATPARLVFQLTELRHPEVASPVSIATTEIDFSGRVTRDDRNRVIGLLGRVVGRGPRDVAEELELAAGFTFELSVTQPVSYLLPTPTTASGSVSPPPPDPPRPVRR